jgi:hypothetical protein
MCILPVGFGAFGQRKTFRRMQFLQKHPAGTGTRSLCIQRRGCLACALLEHSFLGAVE